MIPDVALGWFQDILNIRLPVDTMLLCIYGYKPHIIDVYLFGVKFVTLESWHTVFLRARKYFMLLLVLSHVEYLLENEGICKVREILLNFLSY